MKIKIKTSDIEDEITVCPYCMGEVSRHRFFGCCGETSAHFSKAYVMKDGDCLLENEVEVVKDDVA